MELWIDDFTFDDKLFDSPLNCDVSVAPNSQDHLRTIATCVSYSPRSSEEWAPPPNLQDVNMSEDELFQMLMDENEQLGFDFTEATNLPSPSHRSDWDDMLQLLVNEPTNEVATPPKTPQSNYQNRYSTPPAGVSFEQYDWQRLPVLSPPPTSPVPTTSKSSRCALLPTNDDVVDLFQGVLFHSNYFPFFRFLSYLCEQAVVVQFSFRFYHEARKAIVDCRNRCWRKEYQYCDVPTYDLYQIKLCRAYLVSDGNEQFTELQAKLIERISSKLGRETFNTLWMKSQEPPHVVHRGPVIISPCVHQHKATRDPHPVYWYRPVAVVPQRRESFGWDAYKHGAPANSQEAPRAAVVADTMEDTRWQNKAQWNHWTPDGRDDMETIGASTEVRSDTSATTTTTTSVVQSPSTWE